MGRRARRLRPPKPRRLVDPEPRYDDLKLIKFLLGTHRVHPAELMRFNKLPYMYYDQKPEIHARNRGILTLIRKIAHLRRRYLFLLIGDFVPSAVSYYILDKMEVYLQNIGHLQAEIERYGEKYLVVPPIFTKDMVLRE